MLDRIGMKKIRSITLKSLGLLLLVLIAIVMVRTFSLESRQMQVEAVSPAEIGPTVVDHLSEAIQIKTISQYDLDSAGKAPFDAFITFLDSTYPLVHQHLKREQVNTHSLLFEWKGKQPDLKPVVMLGHMDVVPVEAASLEAWTHAPFSGKVADGFIWGRGSIDDKMTVLGVLETVESFLAEGKQPDRTILLAFGHDEELGGIEGAKRMADLLAERGVEAEFVLDEGGIIGEGLVPGIEKPTALVGIAEKGSLSVELLITMEGGHSSMPGKENAIGVLAQAIEKLRQNPFPNELTEPVRQFGAFLGPEMAFTSKMAFSNLWLLEGMVIGTYQKTPSGNATVSTTMVPTVINGGVKDNVIPIQAQAILNFRTLPGHTSEMILEHLTKVINDERITLRKLPLFAEASSVSPVECEQFEVIQKTIHQVFPDVLVSPYLMVAGADAKHYQKISPNVYRFIPVRFNSEDLKRLHGTNERISVEGYQNTIRFYRQLLLNSCWN